MNWAAFQKQRSPINKWTAGGLARDGVLDQKIRLSVAVGHYLDYASDSAFCHVLRPGTVGPLTMWRTPGADLLTVKLADPSGYPNIDSMDNAHLVKATQAGLLLYGTTLSVKRGEVTELPQAWWCVIKAVRLGSTIDSKADVDQGNWR